MEAKGKGKQIEDNDMGYDGLRALQIKKNPSLAGLLMGV